MARANQKSNQLAPKRCAKQKNRLPGLYACILIGGKSTRMGRPKHLIQIDGVTQVERLAGTVRPFVQRVYISGAGRLPHSLQHLPRLADPDGVAGPIAGLCAAFREHPRSAWLLCACDMPWVDAAALHWLVGNRRIGTDAIIPRIDSTGTEPLLAIYEPPARNAVERLAASNAGPRQIAQGRCRMPRVPNTLRQSWMNVNSISGRSQFDSNR